MVFLLQFTFTFVIGLCLGSFASAVLYRLEHDVPDQARHRSHCPACKARLGIFDLIPVTSWLFLKGRCRYCGAKIPVRYPLLELGFGVLCAGLFILIYTVNPG